MKQYYYKTIAILSVAVLLTGCAENLLTNEAGNVNKANVGLLTGAGGGAWLGSNIGKGSGQIVGIAAGTLLGAFVGHSIGSSLDKADVVYHNRAAQQALEHNRTGTASTWKNPDTGASGSIVPSKPYHEGSRYCREYTQNIKVGDKAERAYGKACRQPDGSWEIVQQ